MTSRDFVRSKCRDWCGIPVFRYFAAKVRPIVAIAVPACEIH
jgi:hypothetical protein